MDKSKRIGLVAGVIVLAVVLMACLLAACDGAQEAQTILPVFSEHVFQSGVVTNTNGTAMNTKYYSALGIQVEGIVTGTVTFEGTIDGATWYSVRATDVASGNVTTTVSGDGLYLVSAGGLKQVRCPVGGYVSGTITVMGYAIESNRESLADVNLSDTQAVDINDVSKGAQTNDVKVTLDSEKVALTTTIDGTYVGDVKFGESLPTGTNALGNVTVTSVTTGTVDIARITNALPAGTNNIGDVDVASALPAGTNAIGTVTVTSVTTGTIDVGNISGTVVVDSELPAAAALADATANPTVPMAGAAQMTFNDTTWDREYGNWDEVAYASAQRTTGSWVDLINYNARGAYLTLNVTGVAITPSITVEAWIYDSASSQYETILVGTAVTAVGRHSYLIYPGAGAAANAVDVVAAYPLPRRWAVAVIHDNTDPITYSIGCAYIN